MWLLIIILQLRLNVNTTLDAYTNPMGWLVKEYRYGFPDGPNEQWIEIKEEMLEKQMTSKGWLKKWCQDAFEMIEELGK